MKIDTTSGDFDYTYLSLGAGVQSSALLVLACTDDRVPKPDVAIFADTGDEPPWVYEYVEILTDWAKDYGVEVITAQKGVLSEWVVDRANGGENFIALPLFTSAEDGERKAILRRQCTREFKIHPITQKVRELLGYQPRQRVKHRVRAMLGITIDEAQRMKPSWHKWTTNCWPLIDLGLHRDDCLKIMEDAGLPEPQKSACVYCPYHSDTYWQFLKDTHPDQFQRAVDFDYEIRDVTSKGAIGKRFLHKTCVPLDEVEFNATDPSQVDMFAECEGMCGV
jgi:hypothetical protein